MSGAPDPRPEPRLREPGAGRVKLLREARCRGCHDTDRLQVHHLVSRGQRGSDVEDNLIPLCGSCHDLIHHGSGPRRTAILRAVGASLSEREAGYVLRVKGRGWLADHYYREET